MTHDTWYMIYDACTSTHTQNIQTNYKQDRDILRQNEAKKEEREKKINSIILNVCCA